jgi:hypothetical protein
MLDNFNFNHFTINFMMNVFVLQKLDNSFVDFEIL